MEIHEIDKLEEDKLWGCDKEGLFPDAGSGPLECADFARGGVLAFGVYVSRAYRGPAVSLRDAYRD